MHKILCGSPEGVKPLGRPRLRQGNQVSKYVEWIKPNADWGVLAEDTERWHGICFFSMVLKAVYYKEEKEEEEVP